MLMILFKQVVQIEGGGYSGRLECQLEDGTWGTVCTMGFRQNSATACRRWDTLDKLIM